MKKLIIPSLFTFFALFSITQAQDGVRYQDEVFDEVSVTSDVLYAVNLSILRGVPEIDSLFLDVYEPVGDTMAIRPLILITHTGNFLPPVLNRAPFGTKTDSANVELATRLAKLGYVVASFEYRLGWNPLPSAPDEVRRRTLLQAAYRGFQDTRTAVRFFRMTEAEMDNPYRVDVNRIAVGGIGTGGYCALGAAYLDTLSEIRLEKFIDLTDPDNPEPYVIPERDGNFDATDTTVLNLGNHPGYASDFNVVFHMGGALGDSSWIQEGGIPSISMHGINDPYAPFYIGNVIVPTTGDIVIPTAAGGGKIAEMNNRNGNNQIFIDAGLDDEITQVANQQNDGLEGLFAFNFEEPPADTQCVTSIPGFPISIGEVNSGPWSWYNEAVYIASWNAFYAEEIAAGEDITGEEENCSELLESAPNEASFSRSYIDTCIQYLKPRLQIVFENVDDTTTTRTINDILASRLSVFPNPSEGSVSIRLDDSRNILRRVWLHDVAGKEVFRSPVLQTQNYIINAGNLPPGMYMARIQANEGITIKKILLK